MILLGTGVAWGSVRSFESGIFHFTTALLGGTAERRRRHRHPAGRHGQPHRRPRQPAVGRGTGRPARRRRRRHQHRHHHPGPHPEQRPLGHAPSRSRATPTWRRRGWARPRSTASTARSSSRPVKELVENQGVRSRRGRAAGRRGRPQRTDQDRRRPHRCDGGPLRRDRTARLLADHRRPRRRRRVPEGRGLRTAFGRGLPGRLAAPGRPAGAELRAAAPRPAARRSRPGGAPAGGDGFPCPPGHFRQDADAARPP